MGTSALIKVEELDVCLYKHYDGCPENTLNWLLLFNKDFETKRKGDPHYKFAQLIRSTLREEYKENLDQSYYTGWGVYEDDSQILTDYKYILSSDGSVKVESNY